MEVHALECLDEARRPKRGAGVLALVLSERAHVLYLENARVIQRDQRVVYVASNGTRDDEPITIPTKNTSYLMLGKGTVVSDAAIRLLADDDVLVAFCGRGSLDSKPGSISFLARQAGRREPTDEMSGWMRLWLDEPSRLRAAKRLMRFRVEWAEEAWAQRAELGARRASIPSVEADRFLSQVRSATSLRAVALAEEDWVRSLHLCLIRAFAPGNALNGVNRQLEDGSHFCRGIAGVSLHSLGIPQELGLLGRQGSPGNLAFDIAELYVDSACAPLAFLLGGDPPGAMREALISHFQAADTIARTIETLKSLLAECSS